MKKKRAQVSNLASVVLASLAPSVPSHLVLAAFSCKTCDHSFTASADIDPYCVHCGSESVEQKEVEDDELVSADELPPEDELNSITCPGCQTCNIMPDMTLASYDGHCFCVSCGTELKYEVPENLNPIDASDDEEDDDTSEDMIDLEEKEEEEDAKKSCTSETEPRDGDPEGTMSERPEVDAEPRDGDPESQVEVELPLVSVAPESELMLSSANKDSTLLAFMGNICVATLKNSADYKHADIFGQPSFKRAIMAAVKKNGVEAALKDFGFELAKIKVDQKLYQTRKVAAAVEQEKAQARQEFAQNLETFRQCMGIASAGLNKNFFKGKGHPLKESFHSLLSSAGVSKPEVLIDRVFASSSDAYHSVLLEVAFDLMSKSAEVRNEIASVVVDSNYVAASSEQEDDEDDDQQNIEDRLERGLLPETSSFSGNVEVSTVVPMVRQDVRQVQSVIGRGKVFGAR